jgi:hypothetical protein
MAVKYLAGDRLIGTAAERAALNTTTPAAVPQTTWKELGTRAVASGGNTTELEVTFTAKDHLMILVNSTGNFAQESKMLFGGSDYSSTDYEVRRRKNDGANDSSGSANHWRIADGANQTTGSHFGVYEVWNDDNSGEKVGIGHCVITNYTGADTTAKKCISYETTASWEHDTASTRITRVKIQPENTGLGHNFVDGTELIVLGMDVDEADGGGTTNFWQEIASVTGDGSSTTMTTGTITLPKYLMMEIYGESMVSCKMRFNGETSSDFQRTYTANGADWTQNNASDGIPFLADLAPAVVQLFMTNESGKEKLILGHTSEANNSSTALNTMELFAKNTDTAIITEISLSKPSGNFTANDNFRIWGHN